MKDKWLPQLIVCLWKGAARVPLRGLHGLAWLLGRALWCIKGREQQVTRTNLSLCYPRLTRQERSCMERQSLSASAATMLELGVMWFGSLDKTLSLIKRVHGIEHLEAALKPGQGVVLLAPHIGNWELLNLWLSKRHAFTAMYAPPEMASLDEHIRGGRERAGAHLVPTDRRGVMQLMKALKRGEMVGVLPDQEPEPGQGGCFAPFFGIPAYTATLLPKLISRSGARAVIGLARRLPHGGGFELIFLPPDERVYSDNEVTAASGANACVEKAIAETPLQYQWEYKRFRERPGDTYKFYERIRKRKKKKKKAQATP